MGGGLGGGSAGPFCAAAKAGANAAPEASQRSNLQSLGRAVSRIAIAQVLSHDRAPVVQGGGDRTHLQKKPPSVRQREVRALCEHAGQDMAASDERETRELARAAAQGDRHAFGLLYRATVKQVHGQVGRLVGWSSAVDDVVNE